MTINPAIVKARAKRNKKINMNFKSSMYTDSISSFKTTYSSSSCSSFLNLVKKKDIFTWYNFSQMPIQSTALSIMSDTVHTQ